MAKRPTGPQPHTATVSPSSMSALSAAIQPEGMMSDRNRTCSSSIPSGTTMGPTSEKGTRRSEEHTSELQSLMRISYAVFCLKKKHKQTVTDKQNNYIN